MRAEAPTRPSRTRPQPTLAELDELLANVRAAGLDVEKAVTGAVRPLPQGVELSAYRIIQEALSNALRHAPGCRRPGSRSAYVLGGLGLRIVNGPAHRPMPALAGRRATASSGMRERVVDAGRRDDGGAATDDGGYEVAVVPARCAAGPERARSGTAA